MPKLDSKLDVSHVAKLFGQSEEYTASILKKHGITSLPRCRSWDDGLDEFYSEMTAHHNTEPTLTKQEFADSCDPNNILDRHARGQDVSMFMTTKTPKYGDYTGAPASYHEALNIVTRANQSFQQLDERTRARFDNDPRAFVDFVSNQDNAQALIDMGLAVAKVPETSPAAAEAPAEANEGGGEGA